ncbi:hypothetical protein [Pontibacillus litoralis]|uniref:hypothetical protein n=1 Tax=Pontibacillus litoralis TaxID=516703 RepID=UPI0006921503|nr:hypothetical protein [Pontibacillus litoralis]
MYRVLTSFKDVHTRHAYKKGDNYPYRGQVTKERVEELSSSNNDLKEPVIEPFNVVIDASEQEKEEYPKHVGGGTYTLSNGDKVKGKEKAFQAEQELR